MGPKDTECFPMAFANWGGMSPWKGQWARSLLVQAWCLRRDDVPRHSTSAPHLMGEDKKIPFLPQWDAMLIDTYLLGTEANATTGNANKKSNLRRWKITSTLWSQLEDPEHLNATKTGPAAWALGIYYLSQYFSKSEKEEERKKKKLRSIYEGSSIPSEVKLLYQGFQKLLSKNYMLETLVVKYCCLVLNIFISFNLHKNSDIAGQILALPFYRWEKQDRENKTAMS